MRIAHGLLTVAAAAAVTVLGLAGTARATPVPGEEQESHGSRQKQGSVDPSAAALYRKECGSCHLAFPPRMLAAEGWRRILGGLERHFGQNAELDAPTRNLLAAHLVAGAGEPGEAGGDSTRITETPWFRDEHEKAARAVSRPSIRTLANCAACHPGAEAGDFDEHRARIPRK
jgi:cytochrome c553